MKSIRNLIVIAILAFTFTSCSKDGLDVNVGVGPSGVWISVGSGGGYYYSGNRPPGEISFVGFVRGGSTDPTSVPIFHQNGAPMGISASASGLSGYMTDFFPWLSGQSPSKLVPVVINAYRSGIDGTYYYKITWVAW